MSIPVIAFFNNKGGVGKTSLVYHLSWMYADRGLRVLAGDLDPQSNLTAAFVEEDRLEELFDDGDSAKTIFSALQPLTRGIGDIADAHLEPITDELALVVGDMALSTFEDSLSEVWPKCMDGHERAFRVTSAFWRILQKGAERHQADVILVDLGPNLGAINRSALIASDFFVIPLGPDLFSIQGLRNLGPTVRRWRGEWRERRGRNPAPDLTLPSGSIEPIGYMMLRHSVRLDRPVKAFERWIAKVPGVYLGSVLDEPGAAPAGMEKDANCIAKLKDYRSLMPLAHEARKPLFFLKPGDGALGAHTYAVKNAYEDFLAVARKIAQKTGIRFPDSP